MLRRFLELYFWKPPADINIIMKRLDALVSDHNPHDPLHRVVTQYIVRAVVSRFLCIASGFGLFILGAWIFLFGYEPTFPVLPTALTLIAVYAIERCATHKETMMIYRTLRERV